MSKPLIAHVLYRFDVGGLENGVVNLINHPALSEFRHAVIALTDITPFHQRITNPEVSFHALHKAPGHGFKLMGTFIRLFRQLKPAILHTRNLAALEASIPALLAGVPYRVHGEHGRDMHDLDGSVKKYQWVRRLHRPFVHRYVALSRDLAQYLHTRVGISARRIDQIYNGVDTHRYQPPASAAARAQLRAELTPFDETHIVLGAVGRMETVKNHLYLAQAFAQAVRLPGMEHARLMLVGDGAQRTTVKQFLHAAGLLDRVWFAGNRDDIPALMRCMDVFVLPSLAEGISNTILEAMASGLPVIATEVGGNTELLTADSGSLVPLRHTLQLAQTLYRYASDAALRTHQGQAARAHALAQFSLDAMAESYAALYRQGIKKS
ncbi:MAG: TIGR03088 family PEP-CTERM/XrtA system glycosyltransferase [Burkholderiaceae bacterium]|nr:MAG: TIGR03088 family PEP-CTERM/XrtA system glycosyltransferase [Burkholderiaceae bacterium]